MLPPFWAENSTYRSSAAVLAQPDGGSCFEPELQLTPLEPVSPDIAGWRLERMPHLPSTAHFSLAPDWVCEVLSKPTEFIDRGEKLSLYAAHAVHHVWLVDPLAKTLEVRTLGVAGRWREVQVFEGDVRVRAAPFDAIELDLGALWGPPGAASP